MDGENTAVVRMAASRVQSRVTEDAARAPAEVRPLISYLA